MQGSSLLRGSSHLPVWLILQLIPYSGMEMHHRGSTLLHVTQACSLLQALHIHFSGSCCSFD